MDLFRVPHLTTKTNAKALHSLGNLFLERVHFLQLRLGLCQQASGPSRTSNACNITQCTQFVPSRRPAFLCAIACILSCLYIAFNLTDSSRACACFSNTGSQSSVFASSQRRQRASLAMSSGEGAPPLPAAFAAGRAASSSVLILSSSCSSRRRSPTLRHNHEMYRQRAVRRSMGANSNFVSRGYYLRELFALLTASSICQLCLGQRRWSWRLLFDRRTSAIPGPDPLSTGD
eukprot:COSAG05_NODE_654_length_8069_cov_3.646926_5_plen_232_part_00